MRQRSKEYKAPADVRSVLKYSCNILWRQNLNNFVLKIWDKNTFRQSSGAPPSLEQRILILCTWKLTTYCPKPVYAWLGSHTKVEGSASVDEILDIIFTAFWANDPPVSVWIFTRPSSFPPRSDRNFSRHWPEHSSPAVQVHRTVGKR